MLQWKQHARTLDLPKPASPHPPPPPEIETGLPFPVDFSPNAILLCPQDTAFAQSFDAFSRGDRAGRAAVERTEALAASAAVPRAAAWHAAQRGDRGSGWALGFLGWFRGGFEMFRNCRLVSPLRNELRTMTAPIPDGFPLSKLYVGRRNHRMREAHAVEESAAPVPWKKPCCLVPWVPCAHFAEYGSLKNEQLFH